LQRIRIGPLDLGDLESGKWRVLKAKERAALIAASLPPKTKRVTDEGGRPIRKGRSFIGRGGRKPNRDRPRDENRRPQSGRRPNSKPGRGSD
ncbi:MAG: hypothetical protein AAGK93_08425, partial [Pseudomonadota bacterium]